MTAKMTGLDTVLKNLRKEMEGIKGRTIGGLLAAGLKVQRMSQQRTPREYGNLIGSAFTRRAQGDENSVEIGYTSAYAVYVHENLEMKLAGKPRPSGLGVYWGPHGRSKFLESALRDSQRDIVDTVRAYARVPK